MHVCISIICMQTDERTLLFCACQYLYTTLLLSLTPFMWGVVLYEHSSYLMCPHVHSPMVRLHIQTLLLVQYSNPIPTPISNFKPHPTQLHSTTFPHPLAHPQLSIQLSYPFLTLSVLPNSCPPFHSTSHI